MNHTGHVVGGIIAGGAVCFLASTTGDVELGWETLNEMSESPLSPTQNTKTLLGLFMTSLFMALFPDLDIQSVSQRWFFRIVFVLLGIITGLYGIHRLFSNWILNKRKLNNKTTGKLPKLPKENLGKDSCEAAMKMLQDMHRRR